LGPLISEVRTHYLAWYSALLLEMTLRYVPVFEPLSIKAFSAKP
jgi:hypothetical protein